MKYENRIVLFIDILGFRSIIKQTIDQFDNDIENKITSLYETLIIVSKAISLTNYKKSKIVTQFSDLLVISFLAEDKSLIFELLEDIKDLIVLLVDRGIIFRGAISYGKLIHDDEIIFGPALIHAYYTESTAALYPRVILDKSLIMIGEIEDFAFDGRNIEADYIYKFIRKDTDEKFYIDYFDSALFSAKDANEYLNNLKSIIEDGLKSTSPSLEVKYGWMQNKFNNMIQSYRALLGVPNLNLRVKEMINSILMFDEIKNNYEL